MMMMMMMMVLGSVHSGISDITEYRYNEGLIHSLCLECYKQIIPTEEHVIKRWQCI